MKIIGELAVIAHNTYSSVTPDKAASGEVGVNDFSFVRIDCLDEGGNLLEHWSEYYASVVSHPAVLVDENYRWFYSGAKPVWAKRMKCKRIHKQTFCREI